MSETRFSPQRDELIAERDHLTTQLEQLGRAPGTTDLDFDEGFADSGQVTAERGEVDALAGSLSENLAEIEAALAKLEDGTYGQCEDCGAGDRAGPARGDALGALLHHLCVQVPLTPPAARPWSGTTSGASSRRCRRRPPSAGRRGVGRDGRDAGGVALLARLSEPGPPPPDRQRPAGRRRALGPDADPVWLRAALLHDVGKYHADLGVVGRRVATVVAVGLGQARVGAWSGPLRARAAGSAATSGTARSAPTSCGRSAAPSRWPSGRHCTTTATEFAASAIPPDVLAVLDAADH